MKKRTLTDLMLGLYDVGPEEANASLRGWLATLGPPPRRGSGSRATPAGTQWVSARDVQALLGCSRSSAFRHVRIAAGRHRGESKHLRVPLAVWERYASDTFSP